MSEAITAEAFPGNVTLYGRIFVRGRVCAVTGLHIGTSRESLQIAAVDNLIVRDPVTNRPYIPGSSIKGKMRSLWEKKTGSKQNWCLSKGKYITPDQREPKDVVIHLCQTSAEYHKPCPVCPIFGVPGDKEFSYPTRLVIRDVLLSKEEAERLDSTGRTDLPYTEVKWEAAIDRVTSAAVPRQMERVPAGTVFDGFELVFSVYHKDDLERFLGVLEAMQLLEDDYLGGQGSRGSGKVRFEGLRLFFRNQRNYDRLIDWCKTPEGSDLGVQDILSKKGLLETWLRDNIPCEEKQLATPQPS